jgi:hypothetical protein
MVMKRPQYEVSRKQIAPAGLTGGNRALSKNVAPIIREIQASGVASHRGIARALSVLCSS